MAKSLFGGPKNPPAKPAPAPIQKNIEPIAPKKKAEKV